LSWEYVNHVQQLYLCNKYIIRSLLRY
jgi:hypothetical protein